MADLHNILAAWHRLEPVTQAFYATIGTYALTAIGTVPVLFVRSAPRRLMDAMMGFAGGVMVAASCWSLLVPAIESAGVGTAALGMAVGGALLFAGDQLLPHLHSEFPDEAIDLNGDYGMARHGGPGSRAVPRVAPRAGTLPRLGGGRAIRAGGRSPLQP